VFVGRELFVGALLLLRRSLLHQSYVAQHACLLFRRTVEPVKADEQMRFIRELWRRRLSGVQRNVEVRLGGRTAPGPVPWAFPVLDGLLLAVPVWLPVLAHAHHV
jgi:hypothetical protein